MGRHAFTILLFLLALFTGVTATGTHVGRMGAGYLKGEQITREWAVLDHVAPSPWCYRPLMPRVCQWLDQHLMSPWWPDPRHYGREACIRVGLSVVLIAVVVLMAGVYFAGVVGRDRGLILACLLSGMMQFAAFGADLSLNSWLDVALIVFGLRCARNGGWRWALGLAILPLAAYNRETSAILVVIYACYRPWMAVAAIPLWFAGFYQVLEPIGYRPPMHVWDTTPMGWELVKANVLSGFSWLNLGRTFGIVPLGWCLVGDAVVSRSGHHLLADGFFKGGAKMYEMTIWSTIVFSVFLLVFATIATVFLVVLVVKLCLETAAEEKFVKDTQDAVIRRFSGEDKGYGDEKEKEG